MYSQNILKSHFNEKFVNAKTKGTGNIAPRNGYYFITDINFRQVGLHGEIPIATCYFKNKQEDWFFKDVVVEIALTSLSPKIGDDFSHILNQTIVVYDAKVIEKSFSNEKRQSLDCQWALAATDQKITTTQAAALKSFIGNATTLTEAWQNFEAEVGIDFTDALEWEATQGTVYDEPADDDQPFDAPDGDFPEGK